MRKITITLIYIFCTSLLSAQNIVKGNVKAEDKNPLQGCTVLFTQADTIVGGTITDKKGNFELKELKSGNYVCKISMIGFKPVSHEFSLSGTVRLPQFTLKEDAQLLDEVKVTGDRRDMTQERAGMTTYFLTERAKKSSDAFEALTEIPRLVVNPSEHKIRLDDGRTPLILINGVNRSGYLNALNPEIIESVEVIDNPSARYMNDESVRAILNVKLKKQHVKPYLNGNIYTSHMPNLLSGGSGLSTELGTATSSIYLTGQHFYFNNDDSESFSDSYSGNIHRIQNGTKRYDSNMLYLNLGGDKIFSDKNYFAYGFKYITHPGKNKGKENGIVEDLSTDKKSNLITENYTDDDFNLFAGDLYYKYTFKKNRTIDFTGNYSYSSSGSKGERTEHSDFYSYTNRMNLDNNRHSGKLDINYSDVINKKITLDMGSKTSFSETKMDDTWDKWEIYKYRRWQEYLYVGLSNNRSKSNFNYILSLGMDMVFTNVDGKKNNYIDVLPSVSLSYKVAKGNTLSLQYNRNRSTPGASMLNPRNTSTDSLFISQGNPFLKPSYTDKVRLGYVFSYKKLRFNPYIEYMYYSDLVMATGELNGNTYISTYENFGHKSKLQVGASINYNLPFGNISANAWYQKDYIDNMPFNGNSWQASLNGYFYYKKVSLSIYLGYTNYEYDLTSKVKPLPYTSANFTWKLPKNWNLNISGEGILCSELPTKRWVVNGDYHSYSTDLMKDRYPKIMLGVSYSFKNKVNMKWRQKKQFYDEDRELQSIGVK